MTTTASLIIFTTMSHSELPQTPQKHYA